MIRESAIERTDTNMISFKTLDGEIARFDGSMTVRLLEDDLEKDADLFRKLFGGREEKEGLELYVAALVCAGDKPIWGVASYGEQYDYMMTPAPGTKLTKEEREEFWDDFNEFNAEELRSLEAYAKKIVIPAVMEYCQKLDNTQVHVIDIRKTFAQDCTNMGYFNPDIVDELQEGLVYTGDTQRKVLQEQEKVLDEIFGEFDNGDVD